ncbi:hypothetical protein [Streptomyces sp. NPDC002851]
MLNEECRFAPPADLATRANVTAEAPDSGLVASHLPLILDPERDDATVVGHLAKLMQSCINSGSTARC